MTTDDAIERGLDVLREAGERYLALVRAVEVRRARTTISAPEIALLEGVSDSTVRRAMSAAGHSPVTPGRCGSPARYSYDDAADVYGWE